MSSGLSTSLNTQWVDPESPVLTSARARALGQTLLRMMSTDNSHIWLIHTAQQITRFSNNRLLNSDDGDQIVCWLSTQFGTKEPIVLRTNQLDETALRAMVQRAEAIARSRPGNMVRPYKAQVSGAFSYPPVSLWHEKTIVAMEDRPLVASTMIDAVRSANMVGAGFIGLMARAGYVLNADGQEAYYHETDCECTVTARTLDNKASGWHGQANRDWTLIDPRDVAETAAKVAVQAAHPVAFEPGRYTTILTSAAVAQLMRFLMVALNADQTDNGGTPFSVLPKGNKLGRHVLDERISINSDPNDPEGGYAPYFYPGLPEPAMTWVDRGTLVNLQYDQYYGLERGKVSAGRVWSFRMSGGTTTVEEMIQSCDRGIYVNRVSGLQLINGSTGMLTGVTCDGCFLVRHGKIDRSIKNLRFADSPFFFLNRLVSLGGAVRAAMGYMPRTFGEPGGIETQWPRRPIIVPPMMVDDFNFSSLADTV